MSSESHIISIQSHLSDITLFLRPADERGMVALELCINGDRFSAPLGGLFPADALLLAAQSLHQIINEEAGS